MRFRIAAILLVLLAALTVILPFSARGQSGIIVDGADSMLDTSVVYSPDLVASTESVAFRVAVEYVHSAALKSVTAPGTTLESLLSDARDRVVTEYASSTAPHALTEPPPILRDGLKAVTARVITEYGSSNRVEVALYPLELIGDTTPPMITNIAVTPVGSSSVNVTWTTDEFATSVIDYGTEPGTYTNTISDAYYTKQHAVAMSSLLPNTTYYFLISSADQSGNVATSAEQSFSTALHIAKSVLPEGDVDYGDELTYSLVIWAMLETQAGLYDPLEGVSFVHFVERPGGVIYDDATITGTLTVPSGDQVVVSFVARVDVPSTEGDTAPVTNDACVYPSGGTIEDDCVWSNEVTNMAFRPYEIYLPVTLRSY